MIKKQHVISVICMYCGTHFTQSMLCSLIKTCSKLVKLARSWRAAKSNTVDIKRCERLFSSATRWKCLR